MKTPHEFYLEWNGKGSNPDRAYGFQCVDLFDQFCIEAGYPYPLVNGAKDFKTKYEQNASNMQAYFVSVSVNAMQDGDWVIWGASLGGGYGHVAMFRKYNSATNIVAFGQNQGAYNGVANQINISTNGIIIVLRPKCYIKSTNATYNANQLVNEHAIATLTEDVNKRKDTPSGAVVATLNKGTKIEYTQKWVGNGHRYVSWLEGSTRYFVAVSGSETQGQDPWATFISIEANTEQSQPSDTITLIEEKGVATLTVDGVRARLNSPTGDVVRTYNTGDKIEYTHKYIGNGHRYIVWTEGNNKIFLAVAGTEDRTDMWATFGSVEDDTSDPVDYTKNVKGYGVDISEHNGENFDVSKYDFVIIRASYGTNKDKLFDTYVNKCEEANIPYGVYCYSYALDNEGAKAEGEFILDLIKDKDIALGVWYDMEDADGYKAKNNALTKDKLTSFCKIFCDVVHSQGYYTGVYSTKHWFETLCPTDYPKWVANWGTNDGNVQADFSDYAVMHQYSANPIDKDVIFYDIEFYESTPIKQGQDEPQETVEDTKEQVDVKQVNSLVSLLIKLVEKLLGIFK